MINGTTISNDAVDYAITGLEPNTLAHGKNYVMTLADVLSGYGKFVQHEVGGYIDNYEDCFPEDFDFGDFFRRFNEKCRKAVPRFVHRKHRSVHGKKFGDKTSFHAAMQNARWNFDATFGTLMQEVATDISSELCEAAVEEERERARKNLERRVKMLVKMYVSSQLYPEPLEFFYEGTPETSVPFAGQIEPYDEERVKRVIFPGIAVHGHVQVKRVVEYESNS